MFTPSDAGVKRTFSTMHARIGRIIIAISAQSTIRKRVLLTSGTLSSVNQITSFRPRGIHAALPVDHGPEGDPDPGEEQRNHRRVEIGFAYGDQDHADQRAPRQPQGGARLDPVRPKTDLLLSFPLEIPIIYMFSVYL